MKAYKILRNEEGKLLSVNPYLPPQLQKRYYRSRVNVGSIKGSGLYVFQTQVDAINFYQEHKNFALFMELWEVKCLGKIDYNPRIVSLLYGTPEQFLERAKEFWKTGQIKEAQIGVGVVPKGSICCEKLKLVRRVKCLV
jgi:hypothetical protein